MPEQLTFDLPVRRAMGRSDFFVSEANALALARLDHTAGWPQGRLALVGPPGSGKTHLASIWAEAEGALVVRPAELVRFDDAPPDRALAIEDADRPGEAEETRLFHVLNAAAAGGHPVLLTARTPPARWDIELPDLASRVAALDLARIEAPDDALLAAVLVKHFADRQISVAPDVVPWLVARIERSFAAAEASARRLDAASLAKGRPVTVRFAARVLDNGARPDR